jgi:hypothetical protein
VNPRLLHKQFCEFKSRQAYQLATMFRPSLSLKKREFVSASTQWQSKMRALLFQNAHGEDGRECQLSAGQIGSGSALVLVPIGFHAEAHEVFDKVTDNC